MLVGGNRNPEPLLAPAVGRVGCGTFETGAKS